MEDREKHAKRCLKHYYANKSDYIERAARWRQDNPERFKQNQRRSRERRFTERWWAILNQRAHEAKKTEKFGPSDLDISFIKEMFERQKGLCYWLGIPLLTDAKPRDPRRPSLDRLNPSRGYMKDNVVLACQFANLGRSVIDADEFRTFIEELRTTLKNQIPSSQLSRGTWPFPAG